ncbi:hypothetical protein M5K25_016452 [Dendrobium thyrsiflorum]|uniref:Uncharacterized protein n=1 Tax=Dendrobium thyrsiflorum TaxID=117978 RepID=A0ABD0UJT8_DENTH
MLTTNLIYKSKILLEIYEELREGRMLKTKTLHPANSIYETMRSTNRRFHFSQYHRCESGHIGIITLWEQTLTWILSMEMINSVSAYKITDPVPLEVLALDDHSVATDIGATFSFR